MKKLFLIFFTCFLFGCQTYVWQPVKKQIIGTWVVIPTEKEIIRWHISATEIIIVQDTEVLDTAYYTIENKISKHVLFAKFDPVAIGGSADIEEWHIIRMSNTEMYISSVDPPRFGNIQIALVKEL